jgi:hypothetical protein
VDGRRRAQGKGRRRDAFGQGACVFGGAGIVLLACAVNGITASYDTYQ